MRLYQAGSRLAVVVLGSVCNSGICKAAQMVQDGRPVVTQGIGVSNNLNQLLNVWRLLRCCPFILSLAIADSIEGAAR
jgi:hypothetical protein